MLQQSCCPRGPGAVFLATGSAICRSTCLDGKECQMLGCHLEVWQPIKLTDYAELQVTASACVPPAGHSLPGAAGSLEQVCAAVEIT